MKITFISNFHNHHQMPLCDAFLRISDVEFVFIATEKVPEERIEFGYKHDFSGLPYYKEALDEKDIEQAEQICFESDVVIIGSAPISFVKARFKARKLTFSYNERWFKEGFFKHPGDIWRAFHNFTLHNNGNFYQLCASAYTAGDSKRVGAFPNRTLRWGYFPEVKLYESVDVLMNRKSKDASILWVARLIELKHPEAVLEVASYLKKRKYSFKLNIIGNGEMEEEVRKYIIDNQLTDVVHMLGSMPPEEVRTYMEKANIFLFTSDYREGWGAVLNEAMSSGCAVVVSHAVGSAPYLVKHGKNGYIYSFGEQNELNTFVEKLICDREWARTMGKEAYYTLRTTWNAEIAANRFYKFCSAALSENPLPVYQEGPLSWDTGERRNNRKE